MTMRVAFPLLFSLLYFAACSGNTGNHIQASSETYGDHLGSVQIEATCADDAMGHLAEGLALLHNMTYEGADAAFAAATEADPDCALGYWGQAMTIIHPIWSDQPDAEAFERGSALIEEAKTRGERTDIQDAWISAATAYFTTGHNVKSEMPNLRAFASAWSSAAEQFPDDPESRSFAALTMLSTVDPSDKSYARQLEAGEMARSILEMIPDHPGGHHYTIHAYDYPPLAERALDIARSYSEIAPAVPHALHMPGHIFTRLGQWEESIALNRRSADAAIDLARDPSNTMHRLHALDYLAYAHLQRGEDTEAEAIARELEGIGPPYRPSLAMAYAFAAVPARLALERQRWEDAAALQPRVPTDFPWRGFTAVEAITWFAKALGAAHVGELDTARAAIERLETLRETTRVYYWQEQIEIQRLAATAWLEFAVENAEGALASMREAAEHEAETDKHPVTPGEVLPAAELLGDLLMEMERFEEALATYEASLERTPNRRISLRGAAEAASALGNEDLAASYRGILE